MYFNTLATIKARRAANKAFLRTGLPPRGVRNMAGMLESRLVFPVRYIHHVTGAGKAWPAARRASVHERGCPWRCNCR
jgi:hypothetical protein